MVEAGLTCCRNIAGQPGNLSSAGSATLANLMYLCEYKRPTEREHPDLGCAVLLALGDREGCIKHLGLMSCR